MLTPKKTKYRYSHIIKYEGHAKGNQEVNFGDLGLQAQEGTYISNRAIEAGRKVISPYLKKNKSSYSFFNRFCFPADKTKKKNY